MYVSNSGSLFLFWILELVSLQATLITGTQASSGGCSTPTLSVAKGSIPDSDITASSELNSNSSAFHGRLGNTKAWIPNSNDKHPWIQVNLKYRRNITAIATQGLQGSYVKWYYVSYGDDGSTWRNYTVQGIIKIKGNVDDTKSETVVFSPSILAQYIRLHPTNCSNKCALRFEVYGCNITTGLPGQPPPPTANSVSMHVIDISWTEPSDTGAGITGYNVQWQVVGKLIKDQKVVTGSRTAKLDVTPYTEYDIQVRAYNGKGDGPWSWPLRVRSKESVPSAAPGNFKLTSSSSLSLDVSWDAIPEEQRQGKLLGYHVYFKIKGSAAEQNKTVGPAQLTLPLTKLEYKIYVVRVAGYTAVGVGKSTAEWTKIPNEGAPTQPRNFKLVVQSSKSIRASWLEPLKFNGRFRRYVVMYGKVRGKLDGTLYTQRTAYLLTPLEEFTEYFVQVYAETSVSGASSNIEQAKTHEDAPSSPPVINALETKAEDAHTIRVKWNEINKKDQNGIILGYFVYYNERGQLKTSNKETTATNIIIAGFKPFTEYCIKVTGHTKVGASPEGNCFFVKTLQSGITVEKEHKGLTFMGITIVSTLGSVVFIVVAALAAVLFKTHRRNPNIPDGANEEEITPYATVRIPLNAENNGSGFPGNHDIPLKTLPFQLTAPTEERAASRTELRNSPYENIDHLGRSSVTPLEYLLYQPRYENEAVDNETRAGVMIRPGYDKLTPATRKIRRENGGAHLGQRLPCGMVDTHCLSEYDSLIWEADLRCKSRRGDITDSKSEDNMNIYTILGVPSCDEGSPPCSMDRRRNQGNSLGDTQFGCIEND